MRSQILKVNWPRPCSLYCDFWKVPLGIVSSRWPLFEHKGRAKPDKLFKLRTNKSIKNNNSKKGQRATAQASKGNILVMESHRPHVKLKVP